MLHQITTLLRSSVFSERQRGIRLLATYLKDAASPQGDPQVSFLVGNALSDQSDLVQQQVCELLLNNFPRIKFDSKHLLPPLLEIFKGKNIVARSHIISILAKILEYNLYPPWELIQKFLDGASKGQKLTKQGVVDLLLILCQITPVYGDTKRLYFQLLFNPDRLPIQLPRTLTSKVQQVVGTHFWNLENQRKVRQVEIALNGSLFPVEGEILPQFLSFVAALTRAVAESTLDPVTFDKMLKRFPKLPLDKFLAPFFFIQVNSVTKRPVTTEIIKIEIGGFLRNLLPLSFSLIGMEAATVTPSALKSTVNPSGEFHVSVQIHKTHQSYIPFTFYTDILEKQVPLSVPFVMPRAGDSALHKDMFTGHKEVVVTCLTCGEKNVVRPDEPFSPAPLYCKACGALLKRREQMHLI